MLTKSTFLQLGFVFFALLTGTLIASNRVKTQASLSPQTENFWSAVQPQLILSHCQDQTQSVVATLANGSYQFCSQPDPKNWQDGAGICFNFRKNGNQVDGYYGYPNSDTFICVKGKVNGNLITGEALEAVWADEPPAHVPDPAFKWDLEGRLILSQGNIIRSSNNEEGYTNWILFSHALLNLSGFYQYSAPRMKPPSELCEWNYQ